MLFPVEPFDQVFPLAAEEVNTTDPPLQNVVGPFGVITGVAGTLFTTTFTEAEAAEHVPLEEVTVYVPGAVTVMLFPADPFDHVFPVDADEVRITDPPSQKVVGPFGVITGAAGALFTVTVTGADEAVQLPLEEVTV